MNCENCQACEQPPSDVEFVADGVLVKQMFIEKSGTAVPQHAHVYDHLSMLASGAVRVWKDGVLDGEYTAPAPIFIRAGIKHAFLALEDKTMIYCIHRLRAGGVEVAAEHQFEGIL